MARRKATWRQAELKLSYGSELWVIVRHRRGSFRLPITASIEELLWGVADGWTMQPSHVRKLNRDPIRPDTRALARLWEGDETPAG